MKITDEQRAKAQELAEKLKVSKLYVNDKGEYFTSENLAQLSVEGNKKKYQKLDFAPVANEEADDIFAQIKALQTVEEVQAILDAEIEGAGDAELMDACEARINELKDAE